MTPENEAQDALNKAALADPDFNPFQFNKADDVKEIMSDLDHSHHFNQAEKELEKANWVQNITLSRLESQPKVNVMAKTITCNRPVKSPDHNNYRYQ